MLNPLDFSKLHFTLDIQSDFYMNVLFVCVKIELNMTLKKVKVLHNNPSVKIGKFVYLYFCGTFFLFQFFLYLFLSVHNNKFNIHKSNPLNTAVNQCK